MYYGFKPYVPVAERRRRAEHAAARLEKKGVTRSPVKIEGRAIAATFWGKAWCDNIERYSDFSNRLPRGRTYVRSGAVFDLQIAPGEVRAQVMGSRMYTVKVSIAAIPKPRWSAVCKSCSGEIDSLVELLQGRLPKSVMEHICRKETGLFPAPREIAFTCSCPDWASLCKHVAAVLYGIGARLDHRPELLFALRKIDEKELIGAASTHLPRTPSARAGKVLEGAGLAEMFGIDLAEPAPSAGHARAKPAAKQPRGRSASAPPQAKRAMGKAASAAKRGRGKKSPKAHDKKNGGGAPRVTGTAEKRKSGSPR